MLDERHPYAMLENDVQQLWQPFQDTLGIPLVGLEFYNLRDGRFGCISNAFRYWQIYVNNALCPTQEELALSCAPIDQIAIQSTEISTTLNGYSQRKYDLNIRLLAEAGIPNRLNFIKRCGEWIEITHYACNVKGKNGLQTFLSQLHTLTAVTNSIQDVFKPYLKQLYENMLVQPNYSTDYFDLMNAVPEKSEHYKVVKLFKKTYHITNKEFECLYFTAHGLTAKEVAKQLDISPRTVEIHLEHIKHKLNVQNKLALCEKYFRYMGVHHREEKSND